jgi:hypothetical protein
MRTIPLAGLTAFAVALSAWSAACKFDPNGAPRDAGGPSSAGDAEAPGAVDAADGGVAARADAAADAFVDAGPADVQAAVEDAAIYDTLRPDTEPILDAEDTDAPPGADALPGLDGSASDGGALQLPFTPSNIDPTSIPGSSADVHVYGACTLDVDTGAVSGTATACGDLRLLGHGIVDQTVGSDSVSVFSAFNFEVEMNGALSLTGTHAVVIVAEHSVSITGLVDGGGHGGRSGPGGGLRSCATNRANGMRGMSATFSVAALQFQNGGGGGGGGFGGAGTAGGHGAQAAATEGAGGSSIGSSLALSPLRGGCSGGDGGEGTGSTSSAGAAGGGGGGAIEIVAGDSLTVTGAVVVPGAGGTGGAPLAGGGGGGSGGAILLESESVTIASIARLLANGGGGGEGGSYNVLGNRGARGARGSTTDGRAAPGGSMNTDSGGDGGNGGWRQSPTGGASGTLNSGGGGGGGGGVGRIQINAGAQCTVESGSTVSPAAGRSMPCGM